MSDGDGLGWLADDPVEGTDESPDSLGRRSFAEAAVRTLHSVAAESPSCVVALTGPWGSGKSSLLNMVRNLIASPQRQGSQRRIVQFNPWFYQDLPTLQAGFFRELASALPPPKDWNSARRKLGDLGRAIAPLGSIGALFGLDATKAIEFFADLASDRHEGLAKRHSDANEALKRAGHPVLVVIDDLDRLAPDELLLVFKLIRLTGRLNSLYYLVSYDEDTLLDALSRTGLIGLTDKRRALDYLEKIIQVRLDVPPLRDSQIDAWIGEAIDRLGRVYGLALDERALMWFGNVYNEHLRSRLNTPRAIKRFFGQVEALLNTVMGEVDPVDFLLISWIRTAEPLVYDLVYRERANILGGGNRTSVAHALGKIEPKERQEHWQKSLAQARVEPNDLAGVAAVLSTLFPVFRAEWAGVEHSPSRFDVAAKKISNPDYFDRFFSFSVPAEDIPDNVVRLALDQIRTDAYGPERSRIEAEFATKSSLILNKFRVFIQEDLDLDNLPLLLWLLGKFADVDDPNSLATPKDEVRWLSQSIFLSLVPDRAEEALRHAANAREGLILASRWIGSAERMQEQTYDPTERARLEAILRRAKPLFLDLLKQKIEMYRATLPFEIPDETWQLLWRWRDADIAGVHAFVNARIDLGEWPVLDTVARLVTSSRVLGLASAGWMISDLDYVALDDFIGVDKVIDLMDDQLDAAGERLNIDSHQVEATRENRRKYVLGELRAVRDGSLAVVQYRGRRE
jgi:predicted KAP-like P-loop ATPase